MQLTVGGVFDGIGLLAYGLHRAGLRHEWLCEVDPWRREVLAKRWPGVPVVPDVRLVGADSVPRVDVIAGGFPCKGASTAGKRNGFDHPETVLWREMRRAIGELRPRYVLIENVANLLSMARAPGEPSGSAWGEVLADLATLGFDVRWDCLPAAAFGAPHLRDRVFAVAFADPDLARADAYAAAGASRPPVGERGLRAVADADGSGGAVGGVGARQSVRGSRRRDELASAAGAAADAVRTRLEGAGVPGAAPVGTAPPLSRGIAVDWSRYEPAVRRWEQIHGPAPEPLVRRVDARAAARVERSQLRALGDGVQVQAAELAGRWIVNHAREQEARRAP